MSERELQVLLGFLLKEWRAWADGDPAREARLEAPGALDRWEPLVESFRTNRLPSEADFLAALTEEEHTPSLVELSRRLRALAMRHPALHPEEP